MMSCGVVGGGVACAQAPPAVDDSRRAPIEVARKWVFSFFIDIPEDGAWRWRIMIQCDQS